MDELIGAVESETRAVEKWIVELEKSSAAIGEGDAADTAAATGNEKCGDRSQRSEVRGQRSDSSIGE